MTATSLVGKRAVNKKLLSVFKGAILLIAARKILSSELLLLR